MALVLSKLDSREWLEGELFGIIDNIAQGNWDALPTNRLDMQERATLFQQWLRAARSLSIPVIALSAIYLAKDHLPFTPDVLNYLIFSAWGLLGITVLTLLDPDAAERFLKLKDLPKTPFGGLSKD